MGDIELQPLAIHIGASFTGDPLGDFAGLWSRALGRPVEFHLAPYCQLYQQLLTSGGALQGGQGPTVLLIRWRDLAGDQSVEAAVRELSEALSAGAGTRACILCPDEKGGDDPLNEAFRVAAPTSVEIFEAHEVFIRYGVDAPFDADADEAAHIPYTQRAFAALSAFIVRRALAASARPIKLLAVDCDNTLWRGVLGEDGANGVELEEGHRALQRSLVRQVEGGRIVALLSKNDERDVDALFDAREDFPLRPEHILAKGVNWRAKAENLAEIAERFGVGEDAIAFLDDNPVEIAGMRAAMPGVKSIETPVETETLARFVDHFWPFDLTATTQEDEKRLTMYREAAARDEERRAAPSLQDFIDSLGLEIDIFEAAPAQMERLAQLTQRTNQFNINLKRFSAEELARWTQGEGRRLYGVSVRDRFGDYGTVGLMATETNGDALSVPLFLLSCRALGRGVEHKMAAKLGALAQEAGIARIKFEFRAGPRNAPARSFFETVLAATPEESSNIEAAKLAQLKFTASEREALSEDAPRAATMIASDDDERWLRIAEELTTGADILAAARGKQRTRPELSTPFAAPAPGLERRIAAIWEDILGIAPVGANDPFTDLGGKSVQLVRIHSRLIRLLKREFDLTLLFEYVTPARLAARLEGRGGERLSAAERAQAMRGARIEHGARLKAAREAIREAAS